MGKKRIAAICLCIAAAILINIYIFHSVSVGTPENNANTLKIEMQSDCVGYFNVYYSSDEDFSEEKTSVYEYEEAGEKDTTQYTIDLQSNYLRLDLGEKAGTTLLYDMYFSVMFKKIHLDLSMFDHPITTNDITAITRENDVVIIASDGGDPYLVLPFEGETIFESAQKYLDKITLLVDILLCVIIDLIVLIGIKYIKRLATLPIELYQNRRLIWDLSKNDFKTKFAGSYLGIIWAFVQPIITVVVYWFVFEIGLRAGRMCDYPFILWLMAGLVPWFFFSEALNGGTNALLEYNYLVKKVVFKISILPIVKVISSIFIHVFFIAFIIMLCWCYGYTPSIYVLQLLYYVFCSFALVLGLSYLTSAVVCFFKDLSQIIGIVLQVGIWLTPIMWDTNILPPMLEKVFKLNPMYYIVDGFRASLLAKEWFWDKTLWTFYFWIVVVVIFGLGVSVFKKLRVHFADVL